MADYSQLVNSGGTIFNQAANVAYQNSDQLAADLGISASQIDWGKISSAPQGFSPSGYIGYTPSNTSSVVADQQMTPQPNLTVPTLNYQSMVNNVGVNNAATENANKSLQDWVNQFTPQQTQLDQKYQDLLDSISSLTGQDTGKQSFQLQQENQFGVPELKTQISDLNSQILTGLAEQRKSQANFDAANQALASDPQQLAGVVGTKQQELMRTYAIEQASKSADLGLLQARQAALGGQLNTALDLAKRATDLKYQPIEDELKIKQAQLQSIQPLLDKQQKIQSQALEAYYNDQQQKIADAKAKAKDNLGLALTAGVTTKFVNKNGEFFRASDGKSYSNPQEFFQDAGVTSFAQAYQQGLITDIDNAKLQDINTLQQIIAKYPDSGVKITDSLEVAKQKLQNSPTYRKDTYIAKSSGGSGNNGPALSSMDFAVRNIIAANPGEWGKAADAIDKKFGKGTATKYDSLLKSVYQDGISIDQAAPLNDIQSIAAAIINGEQPPVLTGLYSKSAAVKAELSRQGFDLSKAQSQWNATQKFLASQNSSTQLRMRQAEGSVENSLNNLQQLSNEFDRTGFKFANKAELTAAANGALGQEKAKQAQALLGQVALITDELGQTFMGGNSPTDAAFELAKKVLQGDFSKSVMDNQIKLIQDNLQYRKNSWNIGPAGIGTSNTYNPSSEIRVMRKSDGQTGTIPESEFDSNIYEKL